MVGFKFSNRSRTNLDTCDHRLVALYETVILHWDCTIIEGHRDMETQNEMHRIGKSHLRWPDSKHNRTPSLAVDAAPYYKGEGIPWEDLERFRAFSGFVLGVGAAMGLKLRWGGDWDGDRIFTDQKFHDLPHIELIE